VAVVAGDAAQVHDLTVQSDVPSDSAIEVIEDERFAFADGVEDYLQEYAAPTDGGLREYVRGFLSAATAIRDDLVGGAPQTSAAADPGFRALREA